MLGVKKIRNIIFFLKGYLFVVLYIPHIVAYFLSGNKEKIRDDVQCRLKQLGFECDWFSGLLIFLHNDRYFRTLFYHRIGRIRSSLFSWYRPGDKYFTLSATMEVGGGFQYAHPYSSVISAKVIGNNFFCLHLTTRGKSNPQKKDLERPVIGNNVTLGANVMILGDIKIGDNVTIGAGSVVTKSVPDNCIVVGNPARIIRQDGEKVNILL